MTAALIDTPASTPAPGDRPVVLEAIHLRKHYTARRGLFQPPATVKALDGVSFRLEAGRTLAVVGESGCGKSTLARSVTMIEPPTEGQLLYDCRDVLGRTKDEMKELRRTVQMVFQNPYGSLNPRKTIGSILEEPVVINTGTPKAERRERALAMMAKVGLRPDQIDRYPHMFSGGQRQRIAIARALMLNPRVVVADEPVSALDVSIQAQVLNLMMDLQEELNLAYLFISHDLSVVRHIADSVMVMYLGRPVEHGPKDVVFSRPRHPYTRILMAATPRVDPGLRLERVVPKGELPSPLNPPPGCAFHKRCPYARPNCATDVPALREVDGRRAACHYAEEME
ncbi:dipeptide transport system ATP-binding protein [Azospirillum fermentarium]|uniref:peptide ABC transporter ATP-binding protein n=1 Tax=Azospirillum fermentarium TaxID=1233114 RepID=UPI00222681D3|nr:peptide ABC transporter ATP-binding protein [Azospirillum fermentarium]MCW2244507.1 dipeptide transport system ATP-binding protein [Azospirillum fermentarium]